MSEPDAAARAIEELLAAARVRLTGVPREALGELQRPRRILGVARAPRVVRVGDAWHLGVLLLTDDAVLATGEIVRARREAIRGYAAESQRARSALAAAASRGGFADGETVHVGWVTCTLELVDERTAPIALRGGVPQVKWSASGGLVPLAAYLDERVDLLLHPPERA
jgi:hypothetical protein